MASPGSCEEVGAWQQALSLFSQIYQADLQPTLVSFNGTISACEKAKEWQQADFPVSGKNMSWNGGFFLGDFVEKMLFHGAENCGKIVPFLYELLILGLWIARNCGCSSPQWLSTAGIRIAVDGKWLMMYGRPYNIYNWLAVEDQTLENYL